LSHGLTDAARNVDTALLVGVVAAGLGAVADRALDLLAGRVHLALRAHRRHVEVHARAHVTAVHTACASIRIKLCKSYRAKIISSDKKTKYSVKSLENSWRTPYFACKMNFLIRMHKVE
jgi:hypothetical protein